MSSSKHYISIQTENGVRQVASIDFYSDGGFFLQDLIRAEQSNKECSVAKVIIDNKNNGTRKVKPHYKAFTSGDVKISHHFDGNFQISGNGVLSGFELDGSPKGASIHSFKLDNMNDGGPFFVMNCWGVERFRMGRKNDVVLKPTFNQVNIYEKNKNYNAVSIKGFYILKKDLTTLQIAQPTINFESPIEGSLNLTIVPTPSKTPGVIGLYASPSVHDFTSKVGFAICGAPGHIREGRFSDSLVMIYPECIKRKGARNLNYSINSHGS